MNKQNKQQGSIQVIIIAVLSLALVGLLGSMFWNNFVQSKGTTTTATVTKSVPPVPSQSPKADPNMIILSDWKVEFTLPESLRNTSVKYTKSSKDNTTTYGFTTKRIEALGGDCVMQPYGKSLVLSRSEEAPAANTMEGFVLINKNPIDGYYYTYAETIPACSGSTTDPSVTVNQVEINDRAALGDLLKSLEATE